MNRPKSAVVYASGRGSNFEVFLRHRQQKTLGFEIAALVTNVEGCGAMVRAREARIPVVSVPHAGRSREEHEGEILNRLRQELNLDFKKDPTLWIILAGYMRLFSPSFIRSLYRDELQAAPMVNIHPSLLPSFPGVQGYEQALKYGVKVTGATVHLVTEGLDDGPIIAQRSLDVLDGDDEASLSARGLKLEHELYPWALHRLATQSWSVSAGAAEGRPRVVFA